MNIPSPSGLSGLPLRKQRGHRHWCAVGAGLHAAAVRAVPGLGGLGQLGLDVEVPTVNPLLVGGLVAMNFIFSQKYWVSNHPN